MRFVIILIKLLCMYVCMYVWIQNSRFLTNNSLYFGNEARQSHSYYGTRIGNYMWSIELRDLWWPWVTFQGHFSYYWPNFISPTKGQRHYFHHQWVQEKVGGLLPIVQIFTRCLIVLQTLNAYGRSFVGL